MNTPSHLALAHESAAIELANAHVAISGAVGLVALLLGWAIHHEWANESRIADFASKVAIIAGSVIMFAGPGASLVIMINNWTVPAMRLIMNKTHISSSWPNAFGLLTAVELLLVVILVKDVIDIIRRRGRGGGSGGDKFFAKQWQQVRFYYEKYGVFAVGPLTITLPGTLGFVCAWPFALLASSIGGLVHVATGW